MTNLERIRREKNLKQSELAEQVGVAQGTISQYEREDEGRRFPDVPTAIQIAIVLGVTVETLWPGKELNGNAA